MRIILGFERNLSEYLTRIAKKNEEDDIVLTTDEVLEDVGVIDFFIRDK